LSTVVTITIASTCIPKKSMVKKYMHPGRPDKLSNNFWVLMVVLFLYIMNVVSFSVHYDLKAAYWYSNINKQFFNTRYFDEDTQTNEQFIEISTVKDIEEYLSVFFHDNFLKADEASTITYLNDKKILYGPYRVHTAAVKTTSCPRNVNIEKYTKCGSDSSEVCYDVKCLEQSSDLGSSLNDTTISGTYVDADDNTVTVTLPFNKAEDVKIDYEIDGEYRNYNGDGYLIDIYPSKMFQQEFLDRFNAIKDQGFLDQQTVVMIISFVVYSKDLDLWAYNVIFLEKNLQGVIYTHHPKSMIFEPHKFQTGMQVIFLAFDAIKVGLLLLFCGFQAYKMIRRWIKTKKMNMSRDIFLLVTLPTIVGLSISYCVFHFHTNKNSKELLEIAKEESMDNYTDLWKTACYYETSIRLEAMLLLIHASFLVRFLRIIPIMNFFFNVIKTSMQTFLPIGCVMIIFFVGLAVISTQMWSSYFYGFKDFSHAFIYIIFLFELSLGGGREDLYDQFVFGYERILGMILIVLLIFTIMTFSITIAVVVAAFKR